MLDCTDYELDVELMNNGKPLSKRTVSASMLHKPTFLQDQWGFKDTGYVTELQWKDMMEAFHHMLPSIDRKQVYGYTGWTPDKSAEFILGDRKITADDVVHIENCVLSNVPYASDVSPKDAAAFYVQQCLQCLKTTVFAQTITTFVLLSLLKSKLDAVGLYVGFAMLVSALSNTGKTFCTSVLVNPWGAKAHSFEDTMAAIIQGLKNTRDLTCYIDDLCRPNDKKMIEKFEKVPRLIGDKTTAGNKIIGNKIYDETINSLPFMTGEGVPKKAQLSTYPRVCINEYEPDEVNFNHLSEMQAHLDVIVKFWVDVLRYVMTDSSNIFTDFQTEFRMRRQIYGKKIVNLGAHRRYGDMLAYLTIGWDLLKDYFKSVGVEAPANDFEADVTGIILKQHEAYGLKNASQMFLTAFFELERANALTVVKSDDAKHSDHFDVIDTGGGELQIRYGAVYKKIVQYYMARGRSFDFTELQLRDDLAAKKLIVRKDKGKVRHCTEHKVAGHSVYTFTLYKNLAQNFLEGDDLSD